MSDSNIVSISGARIFSKGVPQEDVIEMIEEVLEMARRGEIHGAHMVLVHDDGLARKAMIGRCNYAAIGALVALSNALLVRGLDD